MSIDDYLRVHRLTATALAYQLQVSEATVSHWRTGRGRPSRRMMPAIARATFGEVRATDFPPARDSGSHVSRNP
jgi:DNA-binding transcriptional regulator YdaS (Cro superfamily)